MSRFVSLFFAILTFAFMCRADTTSYSYFTTRDGQKIRYGNWEHAPDSKHLGTILILQGRASFIEKHQSLIKDLQSRGYRVWTFDWRGQGGSSRPIDHPQKNHIDTFETHLNDLDQFIQAVVKPQTSEPLFLLGSSMGGHLGLRYLHDHPGTFAGAILMSPMFDVQTDPFPRSVANFLVQAGNLIGFSKTYAIGYGDYDPHKGTFERNKSTHDRVHYEATRQLCIDKPDLVCGGPTFGWVKAAFDSINLIKTPGYAKPIEVPVFIANAEKDKVVRNEIDHEICKSMKNCQLKTYRNAFHNISKEVPEIRETFLKDADRFIKKNLSIVTPGLKNYNLE